MTLLFKLDAVRQCEARHVRSAILLQGLLPLANNRDGFLVVSGLWIGEDAQARTDLGTREAELREIVAIAQVDAGQLLESLQLPGRNRRTSERMVAKRTAGIFRVIRCVDIDPGKYTVDILRGQLHLTINSRIAVALQHNLGQSALMRAPRSGGLYGKRACTDDFQIIFAPQLDVRRVEHQPLIAAQIQRVTGRLTIIVAGNAMGVEKTPIMELL